MLTPEYLAATPDALVELYGKTEQDILANMAERIAKYDYYIPAVQHQHQRLRAMGMLETEIEQQLAALTGKTQACPSPEDAGADAGLQECSSRTLRYVRPYSQECLARSSHKAQQERPE